MMQNIISLVIGIFLLIMAIWDWKFKQIPSIIPTIAIFLILLVFGITEQKIVYYGLIGGLFGLFLWELGTIKGIADIKGIIIICLTIVSLKQFMLFMILFAFLGLSYQSILWKFFKVKKGQEIAYVPLIFITYVLLHTSLYIKHTLT
jgi:hypothetical protein